MTSQGENAETILGPTVTVMVGVNGVNTEALIDTGSPVTIISLSFAMQVLRNDLQSYSSIEEWKQEMFSEPTVILRNYGGHRLEITSQAQFSFSQGGNKERANVLVQKDAPHQVLLGTDHLQPKLGIYLIVAKPEGILTGKDWLCSLPAQPQLPLLEADKSTPSSGHVSQTELPIKQENVLVGKDWLRSASDPLSQREEVEADEIDSA